jgi:hypothetical protein
MPALPYVLRYWQIDVNVRITIAGGREDELSAEPAAC